MVCRCSDVDQHSTQYIYYLEAILIDKNGVPVNNYMLQHSNRRDIAGYLVGIWITSSTKIDIIGNYERQISNFIAITVPLGAGTSAGTVMKNYGYRIYTFEGAIQGHRFYLLLWRCHNLGAGWDEYTLKLTDIPLDKMAAISQTICLDAFSWMNEVCSWGPNRQLTSISLDNGLAPIRQQAIIWANADSIHYMWH